MQNGLEEDADSQRYRIAILYSNGEQKHKSENNKHC